MLRRIPLWLAFVGLGASAARILTGRWWFAFPPTFHPDGYWQGIYATGVLGWIAARTHPRQPLEPPLTWWEPAALLLLGGLLTPLAWRSPGVGLGLAGGVLLGWQALRARGIQRTRYFGYLSVAIMLPLYPGLVGALVGFVDRATPRVFDLRAWQLDRMVGFEPAFAVLRALHRWPLLASVDTAVYNAMPLMVILAVAMGLHHAERVYFDVTGALIAGGVAGVLLYLLYPAAGTRFLCGARHVPYPPPAGFHFVSGGLAPLLFAPPDVWRNCTPSLHLWWALVCLFALMRHSRAAAAVAVAFTIMTMVATLGHGEHWWNDLISSFPLALSSVAATTPGRSGNARARWVCAGGGFIAGVAWICLQRWAQPLLLACPPVTMLAQAALVVGTLAAEAWLARTSLAPRAKAIS